MALRFFCGRGLAASRMPFPRRVYDPPPATNEEIAIVLRKLQIWRKELKGLLISITPRNTPTELIAHILGFVGFDPPQELSTEEGDSHSRSVATRRALG